jgi:hypothetical protein
MIQGWAQRAVRALGCESNVGWRQVAIRNVTLGSQGGLTNSRGREVGSGMRYAYGLLVGLLFCGSAAAQNEPTVAEVPPEQFAILPWGWTPTDAAALREMKAAGFNLAGFIAPEGLDAVAGTGLKGIVSDPSTTVTDAVGRLPESEIAQRVKTLTDRVGSHPAVFGYYLRDEPAADAFEGLAKWSAAFRAAAPTALPYINLFPNYASPTPVGGGTYEEYIESFVRVVKPPFLSYDNYSMMEDGSLRDGYFENLETVRSAALRHKLPFWNVVLSNAHFRYAEPSNSSLSFQVFTTLAYGARGIGYYTYFTPKWGNYRLAPIDQFGHKTPTWDLLRRVNLQILKLAPIYSKLQSVNVFHHPQVPKGGRGLASSRFVAELNGGNLMAGEFEGPQGRPAIMVVNKDLHQSTSFGVRFKAAGPIQMVNSYTGQTHAWEGLNTWLAPGQGMLLFLGATE